MGLSNKIVSKFVKATKNDETNIKKEKIVYGNIEREETDNVTNKTVYYARIDGAEDDDALIPISRTASGIEVNQKQKVIIMIKDHTAIIMGNLDAPSADSEQVRKEVNRRFSEIQSISTEEINALWASNE